MLTIRAARAPGYYERQEFARDDYYRERGECPGQWVGRGAGALGLAGAPREGELGVLLEGRDITALSAPLRTRAGLGRAFQLTNLFPNLTVRENLRATRTSSSRRCTSASCR